MAQLTLPSLRQILSIYRLEAKKALSQNFILNERILHKIVSYLRRPISENLIIEIGPGPGGLTREILQSSPKRLITIEKDERFKPSLRQLEDACPEILKNHFGDAKNILSLDELYLEGLNSVDKIQIVGNLPFGISSILLITLVRAISDLNENGSFAKLLRNCNNVEFLFMFQKELAQRIVAKAGEPNRGQISALCQHFFQTELCMLVPRNQFIPQPKVDAAVVRFTKKSKFSFPFEIVQNATQILFENPRKMIISSLKSQRIIDFERELPDSFPGKYRPAMLDDQQIIAFCKWLSERNFVS